MTEPSQRLYQLRGHLKAQENRVEVAEQQLRMAKAKRLTAKRMVRKQEREEGVDPTV